MIVADDLTTLVGTAAAIGHVTIAGAVTVHVLLYKRNVGAAVSWIGIAWLSPFLGGLLYAIMGVNRVKRRAKRLRRERLPLAIADPDAAAAATDPLTPLEYAVGRLTGLPAEPGNAVEILRSGDESYPRMLQEIERAQKSIGLCSYIFRADAAGEKFHDALIQAQRRGVQVRVLVDGVGGGYFWSGTYQHLRKAGVPVARFLHSYFPWRMPFVNLRNHRKVLVIDGRIAFTGGINIGAEKSSSSLPTPSPMTGCSRRGSSSSTSFGFRRSRRSARSRHGSSPPVPTRTWSRSNSWRFTRFPARASPSDS